MNANSAGHLGPPVDAAGPQTAPPSEKIDRHERAAERRCYLSTEVLPRINVLALEEQQ
jgi:hypothetical protein